MLRFVSRRFLSAFTVLLMVSLITFIVVKAIPGDPAQLILGTEATPEKLAALRFSMGLDQPWPVQYLRWLTQTLRGDWGTSYLFGQQVRSLILQRLPVTLSITFFSMTLAALVSAVLGILSALKPGSVFDVNCRMIMQLASAMPSFWLGMIFLAVFAGALHWFPVTGFVPPKAGFFRFLNSITLPSLILAIGESGILIRMFRSSMLSALEQDYMAAAQVKGLPRKTALVRYALRDALMAPLTLIGTQTAKLFGGTVIIETIFALPGIGRLLLTAVEQRDVQLLQGLVLFITVMVVLMNLLTDLMLTAANPMIRLENGGSQA